MRTGMKPTDITGQRFGLLTALDYEIVQGSPLKWRCLCDCGNIVYRPYRAMHEAKKKGVICSCGCGKIEINGEVRTLVGLKAGRVTVASFDTKTLLYNCTDNNGKTIILSGANIRSRLSRAESVYCNDKKREEIARNYNCKNREEYALKKRRLYGIIHNMRERCYNPKNQHYKDYGARGIYVCKEWLEDSSVFVHWALLNGYEIGLQIDRRNNDDGYTPSNCRFVTLQVNQNNKRSNIYIEYQGRTQTLKQWCVELGLPYRNTHKRICMWNWDVEKAFTLPPKSK